jgi:uncharacterized protein YgiM (DUF1202 family)
MADDSQMDAGANGEANQAAGPLQGIHPGYLGGDPELWAMYTRRTAPRRGERLTALTACWVGTVLVNFVIAVILGSQVIAIAAAPPSRDQVDDAARQEPVQGVNDLDRALQAKFRDIGVVLEYLLDAVNRQPPPELPAQHFFGQVVTPSDGSTRATGRVADAEEFVDIALRPAVGVVKVPSANLRTGPGKEYPVIMEVSKGMRLVIDEYRDGWYLVTAPTGEKLWTFNSVIAVR